MLFTIGRLARGDRWCTADETYHRSKLAFARPADIDAVKAAVVFGVDIVARTTFDVEQPWPDDLRQRAIRRGMSVIFALQLMGCELKKEGVPPTDTQRLIGASKVRV